MKRSTNAIFFRWRKNALKIKNTARRKALGFMIDSIEYKIRRNEKELGEDGR